MNAIIDPAVARLNNKEDEFAQQINSICQSMEELNPNAFSFRAGCDIFNSTNTKLIELNIKRHHDLSGLRINEADQCIFQRSAIDHAFCVQHKEKGIIVICAKHNQMTRLLGDSSNSVWERHPFILLSNDSKIDANFISGNIVDENDLVNNNLDILDTSNVTNDFNSFDDQLRVPEKFEDYGYKTVLELLKLFEKGITPLGLKLLPMREWTQSLRTKSWKDNHSSSSFVTLCKIYIYIHVNSVGHNIKVKKDAWKKLVNDNTEVYGLKKNDGTFFDLAAECFLRKPLLTDGDLSSL